MALGVRVRFRSRDGGLDGERVLHQLPVRLGRNPMNDCPLPHPFISDFHAILDTVDGEICIRDLDSRNGVYDRDMSRLPAGRPVPLAALGSTFVIGRAVEIWIETFEEARDVGQRASSVYGSVLGNRAAMDEVWLGRREGPAAGAAMSLPLPGPGIGSDGLLPLPPLSIGERSEGNPSPPHLVRGAVAPAASQSLPSLPPVPPAFPVAPGLVPPPVHRSSPPHRADAPLPARGGASRSTQHLSMSPESLALLGLRELAASLVPGVRLETTGEVARLITKLHDLVELFCRCFIPLRDGRLGRSRMPRRRGSSSSAAGVERAPDPAALASCLLDWRNHDYDAPEAIESILLDVVMQQAALIDSVVRGVDSLLDQISPDAIEREIRPYAGIGAAFGGYRARWLAFRQRFEELADEKRRLDVILGPEMAAVYRQQLARQGKPGS
jgi:predicted component of type VI protein secretion system